MNQHQRTFIDMPDRIAKLPRDKRSFPVPYFATWIDGVPDFRMVRPEKVVEAIRQQKCWVCGEKLGVHKAFVIGPMCAITRTTSEPPTHRECAIFAARNCPFLANPNMKRNEKHLPDEKMEIGIMVKRNPGVALVWITKSYRTFPVHNGFLLEIGNPLETLWYSEGRTATKDEIMASIESGDCIIRAEAEKDGAVAVAEYERMKKITLELVGIE